MQDLLATFGMIVIKGVVLPVLGLFVAWASVRLPALIKTKVKNARIEGVLERTATLAMAVVQEVQQTVVSKLGDKADETALLAARDQALSTLKTHLGEKGLHEIEVVLGLEDQDAAVKLLITFIEQAVHTLKLNPAPPAVVPVVPVVPAPAPAQGGFVHPSLLYIMGGLMLISFAIALASCGAGQCKDPTYAAAHEMKCNAVQVVVDCTKDVEPAVLQQLGTVFEKVVLDNTTADGSVDWGNVWRLFGGLGKSYGMCLIGGLVDSYAAAPPKLTPGEIRPSVDELERGLAAAKQTYSLAPSDKIMTARGVHR